MSNEILLRLIGPIITAIGIAVQEMRQSRDSYARRKLARAEASEMVTFIEKWIQTQQLICPPEEFELVKRKAKIQLESVYGALANANEARRIGIQRPLWQRILLLYKPATLAGWMTHIAFYVLVLLVALASFGAFVDETAKWSEVATVFGFYFVLILIVRALAVWIESKRHQRTEGAEALPDPL